MSDEEQVTPETPPAAEIPAKPEAPSAAVSAAAALAEAWKGGGSSAAVQDRPAQPQSAQPRPERQARPPQQGGRENRPPREGGREGGRESGKGPQGQGERRPGGGDRPGGGPRHGERPGGGERREGGRPMGRPDMFGEIELDKLINDSLYLDNQAHAVVSRMRDMDSGTRSQLRRLYGAVRRATRAVESERQHEFVMLRARLAYTIARHGLRSLDQIERLLLQVTRKNEARGYERFRDLFEAVVAYNE
jgi:CRISPR type III-A-associated protein Csm2